MLTATTFPFSGLAGLNPFTLFVGVARSYSLAKEYEHMFNLSDADLAARGLSRRDLTENFIKEAGDI